jgi:hypothetical protein
MNTGFIFWNVQDMTVRKRVNIFFEFCIEH